MTLSTAQTGTNPTKQLPVLLNGVQEYISLSGAAGVASVTGTANQITVTGTTNPVLSIPTTFNIPGSMVAASGTVTAQGFGGDFLSTATTSLVFYTAGSAALTIVQSAGSTVNRGEIVASPTTFPVFFRGQGSDTDITTVFASKGNGQAILQANGVNTLVATGTTATFNTPLYVPNEVGTSAVPTIVNGAGSLPNCGASGTPGTATVTGTGMDFEVTITTGTGSCATGLFFSFTVPYTCPTNLICSTYNVAETTASCNSCGLKYAMLSATSTTTRSIYTYTTAATASTVYKIGLACRCK
jgi:hypothetical protein